MYGKNSVKDRIKKKVKQENNWCYSWWRVRNSCKDVNGVKQRPKPCPSFSWYTHFQCSLYVCCSGSTVDALISKPLHLNVIVSVKCYTWSVVYYNMLVCAFSMPRERCRKNLRIFIARMIFFFLFHLSVLTLIGRSSAT